MIEIAIAVVIMLLGAGGYQALASVDFKPIRINIDRRPKVIENIVTVDSEKELAHANLIEDYKTLSKSYNALQSDHKVLECKSKEDNQGKVSNLYNKDVESGYIYYNILTASNVVQYQQYKSAYLDRIEKPVEKPKRGLPGCKWCTEHYLCSQCRWDIYGRHQTEQADLEDWDIMK